jgi:APA family basic amino acid/polyamine antiporter
LSETSSARVSTRSPGTSPPGSAAPCGCRSWPRSSSRSSPRFSYLELVGKYPGAGGAALFTHKAFGVQFLTFMVTFTVMSSGVTSAASAAKAFGDTYLRQFATLPLWLVAAAFVTGLALINFRGVGESMKANVLLTCIELSGLLIIIGAGMWAIGQGQGDASRLVEVDTSNSGVLLSITAATSLAFFAMVGFEDSVNMAEETRGR